MLVDTHCHLDFTEDPQEWIDNAIKNDVRTLICVGTSIVASKKCVDIAEKYSTPDIAIYASVGLHPQEGQSDVKRLGLYQCINTLKQITSSSNKIVAVGECGLDYYPESDPSSTRSTSFDRTQDKSLRASESKQVTSEEEKDKQRKLFVEQIKLAKELDLPLLVHCRNGWDEIFDLLSTVNREPITGLFHSWTGDWQAAKKALDLGFYISFSGILTFKNAPQVHEVAKKVPLDRVLLETDSPFLSPEPLRGKTNSPKNVKIVAEFLAKLRGQSPDRIGEVTTNNASKLFKLEGKVTRI